jgi:primosomal protein N' (replication factor Y)
LGEALGIIIAFEKNETMQKEALIAFEDTPKLSDIQQNALNFLKSHQVSLLFGDTGSGKTEIYISYFQEILSKGKSAIFLMPEISLTPQMEKRLKSYFKENVIMWHSKLTKKQKQKALLKLKTQKASIIAGARSALFLPVDNLGLIVVDEEHDQSYKSNANPRYNARDLAVYIAKLYNINVVLGSATPSLNSYVKYPFYRLKGGHFKANRKFVYEKSLNLFTPLFFSHIENVLKNNRQCIIFLPTRANYKYLICQECGKSFKCVYCDVGMSLHLELNALKCHYCGFMQPIPKVCPSCGSDNLQSNRMGTAQALSELSSKYPNAVIKQFDKDTITTQRKLKEILKQFNDKKIDILIGTQMLSKGHDYHDVTLAVVFGIDYMLGMGDFRAREKALSLLIQIAGRSGRKEDSTVFVQTFNQEFFENFIDDYEKFLKDEIYYREGLYPPFKKLARILFSDKNYNKAKLQMQKMKENLLNFKDIIEIVGSGESTINKVSNKFRFEILLRSDKSTNLIKAIKASMVESAQVDMDPLEFI